MRMFFQTATLLRSSISSPCFRWWPYFGTQCGCGRSATIADDPKIIINSASSTSVDGHDVDEYQHERVFPFWLPSQLIRSNELLSRGSWWKCQACCWSSEDTQNYRKVYHVAGEPSFKRYWKKIFFNILGLISAHCLWALQSEYRPLGQPVRWVLCAIEEASIVSELQYFLQHLRQNLAMARVKVHRL